MTGVVVSPNLAKGGVLAKNTFITIVGQAIPLLVALVSIPLTIKGLGVEKFGILTISWMVLGYFSLFDLGVSRALTRVVSEKLGAGSRNEIPQIIWTAVLLMVFLGGTGLVVVGIISKWLVYSFLKISSNLREETLSAFYLLSVSIPVVILTATLRGVLEAYQRFDLVNYLRTPMGVFLFLGPLIVIPYSHNLALIVGVMLGGRAIILFFHMYFCVRIVPELMRFTGGSVAVMRDLISYGGWLTVTNIIGPLMAYMDRFIIGAILSASYVAFYATPYDVASNLNLIPGAFVTVLFPAFASVYVNDPKRAASLYEKAIKYTFLALFPVAFVLIAFSREILGVWLGSQFAINSTLVLQLLVFGRFLNGLAQIPYSLVQSVGRPDLTAKLHFLELPFYLIAVILLTREYGIAGAATAWLLRVGVDTIALFVMAGDCVPGKTIQTGKLISLSLFCLLAFALPMLSVSPLIKIFWFILLTGLFGVFSWGRLLDESEKVRVKIALGSLRSIP